VQRVCRASFLSSRAARWPIGAALAAACAAVAAQVDQHAEERFDEARANPTPVGGKGNWVIVPIPVANPTIGNGLQLAALYLHPKKPGEESAPGATSGLVALGTDKGARVFGGFHDGSYDQDRYRLNVFAGSARFNLKFYGIGEHSPLADNPVPYEMDGGIAQVRGGIRIPGTAHLYGGLTYQFVQSTLTFKASAIAGELPDVPASFHSAALGPQLIYDSRDSNYYPQSGQYARVSWLNYGKRWGGDFDFDKVDAFYNHYWPIATKSVLAFRVRYQAASEGTPFFFLPTLDMRGFSADRYRDNHTVSGTAEWRQKLSERWGVVGYAEAGRFASSAHELKDGRTIRTLGGGVRWRVTAERDMNIGVDYAHSSDDRAVFIQIAERF
jgi:hypothetical protein